ncbi:helix-turn-helix domain-containing protein [Microbacterium sp. NPDC089318]
MTGRANVFDGITAVVSGRAARRLYYFARLDELAERVRGRDPELDQALETLRVAGERWARSESGTPTPPPAEPRPEWVGTKEAADMLGMTDRGVRKAIAENRLPADCSGGPWLIHREQLAHFAATRKAS